MSAGQPIFVLSEDSERTQGRDAQSANITAGKAIAEAVRSTLGPNGMDKMLVSDDGDVVVTNDGATILDEMDIEHPAAQMLVEVAETQEEEVGDGTTTAAVLTGELLSQIEELLEQEVHPTTIVQGYAQARQIALETVEDSLIEADLDDELLEQVAVSSMTGKGTGGATAETLAAAVVDAVRAVATDEGVDREDIEVFTQSGRSSAATELVEGVVFTEGVEREDVPRRFEDATVAIIEEIDHPDADVDVEYAVDSPDQLSDALAAEAGHIERQVEALAEADVDVVFADGDIEDEASAHLARHGIAAYDSVLSDNAGAVRRATGATPVHDIEDLDHDDLGHADVVRRETHDDDEVVFVESADTESITLFVRGGTGHVIDEIERAVEDGVDAVVSALSGDGVVPGAGATEIGIATAVRQAAAGIEGREQLAVEAYADALEAVPRTLASNSGMDPIDALVDLRAANESGHAGIIGSGGGGEIDDPIERGVLDPAAVKREALGSATESATMLVRIDDVISAQ